MRRSSFPPQLRKFVDRVDHKARAAGHTDAVARIYGAWAACFVRFCTLNDREWSAPEHVPDFLEYLETRQDVNGRSYDRAAESMVFLFDELLDTDVTDAPWHPDRRAGTRGEARGDGASTASEDSAVDGEQSTLLTRLLFHTSLPINEALELCAGDVDLDSGLIYVSDQMGTPKRIVELPDTLYDPLRRHLHRLRNEEGPRYFDAPLFQARAIQGRVNDRDDSKVDEAKRIPADASDDGDSSDGPSSLWGYAGDS